MCREKRIRALYELLEKMTRAGVYPYYDNITPDRRLVGLSIKGAEFAMSEEAVEEYLLAFLKWLA